MEGDHQALSAVWRTSGAPASETTTSERADFHPKKHLKNLLAAGESGSKRALFEVGFVSPRSGISHSCGRDG